MRIASYNIRKAVGLDWRRDPDRIVDVLAEIDADVIVLQEADKRVGTRAGVLPLEYLETELGYIMADVSLRPLSHGWHGNAILMRSGFADHVPARIELPVLEPRGAVSVLLEQPHIEVIGVHLGLTPGMRRKQMLALQKVVDERDHPVLLAGDFNEWNSAQFPFVAPVTVVSPGPSFHASRPTATLDRFVLGQGLRAVSSHVHHSSLAKRASDHLPIVIDLAFAETAQ
ncbi:endonuclease/exonuclease/phosphatase family protein [Sulfitobacter pseudonitzschiae]|uniref:Endonuclease/exonuclease/phosphatase family protein n=1 Tax=Pseudosulfitobacter pseudonitzschiae TaxID=1402135 RepID=A0A9Q2NRY4_9RHOB|nr:endonuclease/exonuclease/phosphatase family protein [Pseudosulfitobacter pseudonitzschiae]MBM2294002.1 endonuclease/exonuclease/phosphatase family protein [Pseudosulfitobacter pseudonitzschiae]MBM2298925.1 endonuclease/exonuclease/phosphatase family protein [Pseudosulfitobacter pseudonitzschiae]MBM2303833.1 endonuclease/exonuclease/phosphatase family protein [Pseudosulfitobacter pseudonitzschiae]MBM2313671.1 endonuclease/exonuclease/phosphatase family protein [Pseudosulfitobacter pseudonitzs|tara:strand:+ start:445 stop:1128 length:684 start_codon:yes stop_codon:yes gene_type:complete